MTIWINANIEEMLSHFKTLQMIHGNLNARVTGALSEKFCLNYTLESHFPFMQNQFMKLCIQFTSAEYIGKLMIVKYNKYLAIAVDPT